MQHKFGRIKLTLFTTDKNKTQTPHRLRDFFLYLSVAGINQSFNVQAE